MGGIFSNLTLGPYSQLQEGGVEEDQVRKEGPRQGWKEPDCLNISIGLQIIPRGSAFDREGFFFHLVGVGRKGTIYALKRWISKYFTLFLYHKFVISTTLIMSEYSNIWKKNEGEKDVIFIFIKCRFNFQLFAPVNIISLQILPWHQPRRGCLKIFSLNKCLSPRIHERSNKDKFFCKHFSG